MKTRALPLSLWVLLAVGMGLAWGHRHAFAPEAVTAWVVRRGPWGPLAFVGLYWLAPALLLPGSVLTLAGGALFGPLLGAVLSLIGATGGATVAFLMARYLAADWVEARVGGRLRELRTGVEREGWRFVALLRLVPIVPFNLLNCALGLTRLSVSTFALTSLITRAPGALAYGYLGYAARETLGGGGDLVRKAFLALTLLVAVALLPTLLRHWQYRPEPHRHDTPRADEGTEGERGEERAPSSC